MRSSAIRHQVAGRKCTTRSPSNRRPPRYGRIDTRATTLVWHGLRNLDSRPPRTVRAFSPAVTSATVSRRRAKPDKSCGHERSRRVTPRRAGCIRVCSPASGRSAYSAPLPRADGLGAASAHAPQRALVRRRHITSLPTPHRAPGHHTGRGDRSRPSSDRAVRADRPDGRRVFSGRRCVRAVPAGHRHRRYRRASRKPARRRRPMPRVHRRATAVACW